MDDVYNIFSRLRSIGSTNAKLGILEENSKNTELREYFKLICDPMTKFYIRKIPSYDETREGVKSLTWAYEQLKVLSARGKTGNAGKDHLRNILENMSEHNRIIIKNIILKETKCGVAFKSVNKIWPGLVKKEPYQRFPKESERNWSYIKYPAVSTCKLDGEFIDIQIRGSENIISFITRGGHEINFKGYHDATISELFEFGDFVINVEALVWDTEKQMYMPRTTGNGIINSNIPDDMIEHIHFKCINTILWESFVDGYEKTDYLDRLHLTDQFSQILNSIQFETVEYAIVNSKEEAITVHEERRARGEEGSVIYNSDSDWEDTDAGLKGTMKQKQREPIDLEITDWKPFKPSEGDWDKDDERQHWIGSLKCESSDGKVVVWCGSMKEHYRKMDPNDFIGKIAIVNSNDVILNAVGDKYTLFLGAFAIDKDFIRTDKTEADSFEDICTILKAKRLMTKAKRTTKKSKLKKSSIIVTTEPEDLEW